MELKQLYLKVEKYSIIVCTKFTRDKKSGNERKSYETDGIEVLQTITPTKY